MVWIGVDFLKGLLFWKWILFDVFVLFNVLRFVMNVLNKMGMKWVIFFKLSLFGYSMVFFRINLLFFDFFFLFEFKFKVIVVSRCLV